MEVDRPLAVGEAGSPREACTNASISSHPRDATPTPPQGVLLYNY